MVASTTARLPDAVLLLPPLVVETVTVFVLSPAVVAVTSTLIVQVVLTATEPPLKLTLPAPAVAVNVPPQVFDGFGVAATCIPLGKLSVNATPDKATVFDAGFWIVIVIVLVPPTAIGLGENDFVTTGGVTTVTVFDTQLLFVSSSSATTPGAGSTAHVPPLLGLVSEPAVFGATVTGTLNEPPDTIVTGPVAVHVNVLDAIEQLMFAGMSTPDEVIEPAEYEVTPEVGRSSCKMTCGLTNEAVPAVAELLTVSVHLNGVFIATEPLTSFAFVTVRSGASGTVLVSALDVTPPAAAEARFVTESAVTSEA